MMMTCTYALCEGIEWSQQLEPGADPRHPLGVHRTPDKIKILCKMINFHLVCHP
jgi:hypothetical protein